MSKKLFKTLTLTTAATVAMVAQTVAAEEVVAKALATTQEAQATVAQTATDLETAQTLADQATLENLEIATQMVDTAQKEVTSAENALTSAKDKVVSAQDEVATAQRNVSTQQVKADKAQSDADTAKAELDRLASDSDAQAITTAQSSVKDAERAVDVASQAVQNATSELTSAKAQDAKLTADIDDAKKKLSTDQTDALLAQTAKDIAQAEADKAEKVVVTAQAVVDAVKPEVSYTIDIQLTPEVKTALLNIINFGSNFDSTFDKSDFASYADYLDARDRKKLEVSYETEEILGEAALDSMIRLMIDGGDKEIDVFNVTEEQLAQANLFYINFVNALRADLGLEPAYASELLIDVAQHRAVAYDAQDMPDIGHINQIINDADEAILGKRLTSENLSDGFLRNVEHVTFADYLRKLQEAILAYVFRDGPSDGDVYGHMLSHMTEQVLGVATYIEEVTTDEYDFMNGMRFRTVVADYTPKKPSLAELLGTTEIDKRIDEAKLVDAEDTAYQSALAELAVAQSTNASAQASLVSATSALKQAQDKVEQVQAVYNQLLVSPRLTATAESKLEKAQSDLNVAQANLAVAQKRLVDVTVSAESKAQALAEAQVMHQNLVQKSKEAQVISDQAQSKLTEAQTVLAVTQENLNKAQVELEQAKQAVRDAQDHKDSLLNAQENLSKAKLAYEQAVKADADADLAYQEELAKLEELKVLNAVAKQTYKDMLDMFEIQQENQVYILPDGTIVAVPKAAPKADPLPEFDLSDIAKEIKSEKIGKKVQSGSTIGTKAVAVPQVHASVNASASAATTTVEK